jgi:hypothetical protein
MTSNASGAAACLFIGCYVDLPSLAKQDSRLSSWEQLAKPDAIYYANSSSRPNTLAYLKSAVA